MFTVWMFNDFYVIFLARCATMALKYGFYSKENFYIFRNSRQNLGQILDGLVSTITTDARPESIQARIEKTMAKLSVSPEYFKI